MLAFTYPAEHTGTFADVASQNQKPVSFPPYPAQEHGSGAAAFSIGPAPWTLSFLGPADTAPEFGLSDVRLLPHYPTQSPLVDVLRLVSPGSDEFITEKYAFEIESLLKTWGLDLKKSPSNMAALAKLLDASIVASSLVPDSETTVRSGPSLKVLRRKFGRATNPGRERFLKEVQSWLGPLSQIETAEFEMTAIEALETAPLKIRAEIRYDIVGTRSQSEREERVGAWHTEWSRSEAGAWSAGSRQAREETLAVATEPAFIDVTAQALAGTALTKTSCCTASITGARCSMAPAASMFMATTEWPQAIMTTTASTTSTSASRPACPTASIAIAATEPLKTSPRRRASAFSTTRPARSSPTSTTRACRTCSSSAAAARCSSCNQGDGTFLLKRDAFQFKQPPQGTFTHAAVADYDRDGRLDIYFCLYSYYLGLDQYHYPVPYYDARNGPPNCLLHNEGNATFVETTEAAGLNAENDRYSFACAWGDFDNRLACPTFLSPTISAARNSTATTATVPSTASQSEAHVEDAGAGMSCLLVRLRQRRAPGCLCAQHVGGGRTAGLAAKAVSRPGARRTFARSTSDTRAAMRFIATRATGPSKTWRPGRSRRWDAGPGAPTSGTSTTTATPISTSPTDISRAENRSDLASFFWRQVVAKSPEDATSSPAYERGWNAINELTRSDHTWHGYARNVMFANNRDGTFSRGLRRLPAWISSKTAGASRSPISTMTDGWR